MQTHNANVLDFRRYFWSGDGLHELKKPCLAVAFAHFGKHPRREVAKIADRVVARGQQMVDYSSEIGKSLKDVQFLDDLIECRDDVASVSDIQQAVGKLLERLPW